MDVIIQFFSGLIDGINALFRFIVSFISDLVYLVQLLGSILAMIPDLFSWMPSWMSSLLITLLTLVVLYKILGREG